MGGDTVLCERSSGGDSPNDRGNVIGTAQQIGQVHQGLSRVGWRQRAHHHADEFRFQRPGQTVAAQEKAIARLQIEWSFHVDGHGGVRTERAGDHVLGDIGRDFLLAGVSRRSHFPDQAVVEGELLQVVATEAIDATVADVGRQRTAGQQQETTTSGAHPLKIDTVLPFVVDHAVGLLDRFDNRFAGREVVKLVIAVRNIVGGQLASQFAGGVGAHAVGYHEQMTVTLVDLRRIGQGDR